jgi:hypothetical protein
MIDIEQFNRPGSKDFIYILNTRAGGLGVNLQVRAPAAAAPGPAPPPCARCAPLRPPGTAARAACQPRCPPPPLPGASHRLLPLLTMRT